MTIRWAPKVDGAKPAATTIGAQTTRTARQRVSTQKSTPAPADIGEPQRLATPETAGAHPSRQQAASKPALFEREIARLRQALKAKGATRSAAAVQALALCATYGMRRSRGARRQAIDLCNDVAETADDGEDIDAVAHQLRALLQAEGDLQEVSADGTLSACRTLIDLLDKKGERA